MKIRTKCSVLLFALVSVTLGLKLGCGGYYGTLLPGLRTTIMVAMAAAMLAVRIITDPITEGVIRAPSPWRLAIDLITFTELVITKAAPITSGDQDIGHGGMVSESGSTAITSCEEDIDRQPGAAAFSRRRQSGDRPS